MKISTSVRGWHGADLAGRVDAVQDGKLTVEDGDIRLGLDGEVDCLPTVLGLGDDLPSGLAAQDGAQPGADHVMVVGDQDARHVLPSDRQF